MVGRQPIRQVTEVTGTLTNLLAQLDPESKKRKGDQFEAICVWFLENDPRFRHLAQVWLWDDWPGNWGPDNGIDLIAEDNEGRIWAIQTKAYQANYWIKKADVDTFLTESGRKVIDYRLLIATTDHLGENAERVIDSQEKPVSFLGLSKMVAAQVNWPALLSDLVAAPLPPKRPEGKWAYQDEAMNAVVDGFNQSDRGQLIMACGTGKTLTALFVKEKMGVTRTLVLAPSLSLLSQTLVEWTANAKVAFEYLPVCSDETVADSTINSANELGDRVTTDPVKIADFLRKAGPQVVFATYQSSPEVAAACTLDGVAPFDLVVADEAHRTTGLSTSVFTTVLDDAKIPATRRLFMTATPRYFTGRVIGEASAFDFAVASMDNKAIYGPVFHRLPFSEAIERGLLTDYQVVVIGVDEADCREMADKARFVRSEGIRNTDARTLAAQVGLGKAMRHYDLRRVISFHSRVIGAREFSGSLAEVISWMPADQRPTGEVWASYVSGEMSARQRAMRLRELGNIDTDHRGLLSNARCLTEGVDVPTLDGVVFIDPKRSEVDIVQAVGRAIRLAPDKTVGTIVIPVFVSSREDHETVLDDSSFKTVWEIVKALRLHDEELAEQLDALRRGLGLRGGGQPILPKKIHLDLPTHITVDFARAFDTCLVNSVTAPWMEWFGLLQKHYEETGTTRGLPQGNLLDSWSQKQRFLYQKNRLLADRAELLSNLGDWSWEPRNDRWEKMFELLKQFIEENGHALVPNSDALGRWVVRQRSRDDDGTLPAEYRDRLNKIPEWTWDPKGDQWEEWFSRLLRYVDENGHASIPKSYTFDGYPLGTWAAKQRARRARGVLRSDREQRLKELPGWSWAVKADQWEVAFRLLLEYVKANGHARVRASYEVDGVRLGRWAIKQRAWRAKGDLPPDREQRLSDLPGWSWNVGEDQWEEGFGRLLEYIKVNGHARIKAAFKTEDDYRLGQWVTVQRQERTRGTLEADRQQRLQDIPEWTWDPLADLWEEGFRHAQEYVKVNGHAAVPQNYVADDEYALGAWIATQRFKYSKNALLDDRVQRLSDLTGWVWDTRTTKWPEGFGKLQEYYGANGTTRVLQTYKAPDDYPLGTWVSTQRSTYRKGAMPADRIALLENLGDWTWDTRA
jgi:superfamily II DNA or RNA helicase